MPPQQPIMAPRRRSLENVSAWVLLATLVVSVFAFVPSVSISYVITKSFVLAIGALLTLALFILARLSRGNIILPPLALVGALWLPFVAYLLSGIFSGSAFSSALWGTALEPNTIGFILVASALGTLAALVLRRPEHYRAFLTTSTYTFLALVAVQIIVLIVGQASSSISPAFSVIGSLEDLAVLAGLGLIGLLLAFREFDFSGRKRNVLVAGGVGALVLLAIANSTLVWVLVALVAFGLFVEAVMQRSAKGGDSDLEDVSLISEEQVVSDEGSRSLVMPLAVLAVSLFFLIGSTLGGALADSLGANEINVRPSWQATFSVGREVLSSSPIFGSGPATFGVEWLKHKDAALNSSIFWNVNFTSGIGFIPTSVVSTGILGALAWIIFLAAFLVLGLRTIIARAPEDPLVRFVATTTFLGSIYLFIVALLNLPNTVVIALAFVFAGIFASTTRFATRGGQWGVIFSRSPRLGFIIVFSLTILLLASVIAAYGVVGRYVGTARLASANTALATGDLDAAERAVGQSLSFAPSADAYQMNAAIEFARLNQIVASTTISASAAQSAFQTSLSSGINAALTATEIAPDDYQNWIALGNLYAQAVPLNVEGAYDNAKSSYERAKELNPNDPRILYTLAQLAIANRDNAGAQEYLKEAITLKQDYTAAIFLLSQLEVQAGNVRGALESALAAAYFTPNDPNILFQVGVLYAAQRDYRNAAAALEAATQANPQFANARYFLAAVYARQGNTDTALAELQKIADLSPENADTLAPQIADLKAGKNPFPANLLTISTPPVEQ